MLDQVQHILFRDRFVQVVGIHFEEGAASYHCLKVRFDGKELTVEEEQRFTSKEDLFKALDKNKTVLLSFTGKGVLHKQLKRTPDYRSKILLNVDPDDFYFYEYGKAKEVFVAVIRKNQADPYFEEFKSKGFMVMDYAVGDFISILVAPFVGQEKLQSHDVLLHTTQDELTQFSAAIEKVQSIAIGDQKFSSDTIGLFATAFNYFVPSDSLDYEHEFLVANKEEKKYKRLFDVFGVTVLVLFLLSLVVSYLLLGHFNEKIVETSTSLSLVQDSYEKVKQLEEERVEKRKVLEESGVMTQNFLSFYCNELTVEVPHTITLDALNVFPTTKKIKAEEKVFFESNKIIVHGVSTSNSEFNEWYKGLKKKSWVKTVDIGQYTANKSGQYDFVIHLMIQ